MQENLAKFLYLLMIENKLNDRNEFENYYNEIYPPELILKRENTSNTSRFLSLYERGSKLSVLI